MNAKLTSGFFIFQLFSCCFSFVDSIIKLNQWIFEHTNQAPGNHSARVTSGCLWIWLSFSYPPACFPRLSVVLFFFSQAFFLQSQEDTFLLYHCRTNLWVDCKKQNFEIHLRWFLKIFLPPLLAKSPFKHTLFLF